MNKNVENYLNNKESKYNELDNDLVPAVEQLENLVEGVESGDKNALSRARKWLQEKGEALKEKLQDSPSKLAQRVLKLILTLTLVVSLTANMTGCVPLVQQQTQQPDQSTSTTINPTNPDDSIINNPSDPNAIVLSNSGVFEGVRYDEVPIINHRTEEEIARTGLTAQDVLNAYDQLAIDIAKKHYNDSTYNFVPKEAIDNLSAQFVNICPWSYSEYDQEVGDYVIYNTPFYAIDPNFQPPHFWLHLLPNCNNKFPAYPTTLSMQVYIDGIIRNQNFYDIGIETSQFEQTMKTFNQEPYLLDHDTFMSQVEKIADYNKFGQFYNQKAYGSMIISRETILSATPEQLKAIYNMISSLRSINFEQSLPEELNIEMVD